jgi:hypothetical protein
LPRAAEPSAVDGALTYNPRDGLVTVIAYIKGEEYFSDDNSNGVRDGTEQFVDQGEPYVDANDNGTWDPGESYVDEAPADGMWNGPNGMWDAQTTVWTETRLLFSGRPLPYITPATFGPVPVGGQVTFDLAIRDKNFNFPQSMGTLLALVYSGTRGTLVSSLGASITDAYGFGVDRRLVSSADQKECAPSTPICQWRTLFTTWSSGALADKARVLGSNMVTGGSVPATVEFRITSSGTATSANATGTVE